MKKCLLLVFLLLLCVSGCRSKITAKHSIQVGADESITMNGITFTFENADICKEVKPKQPNGYYNYYEEKKGYSYYIISGTAENKGLYVLDAGNIMVQGIRGRKTYEGTLLFSNHDESNLVTKINKGDKLHFSFIILMKEGKPQPDKLEIYYTKDFKAPRGGEPYDESIIWTLPSS
ncbi:hypothetical protein [Extibacter muris]|uniref:hypothetical protein n=1 Tax=Extibacter muris TaxID=1796622 RepID=UPI001D0919F3|nr:hypothetical protein [Extibacter muris]MCB6203787.1 hypothetical protein [Extibacter muris]MCQ4665455.1 hypothetical protein [Extibacter muris]MCQ4695002.1 hypothetical protein [Extibacter muris]